MFRRLWDDKRNAWATTYVNRWFWLGATPLDREPRLNRIRGYRYLPELRAAIQKELGIRTNKVVVA